MNEKALDIGGRIFRIVMVFFLVGLSTHLLLSDLGNSKFVLIIYQLILAALIIDDSSCKANQI